MQQHLGIRRNQQQQHYEFYNDDGGGDEDELKELYYTSTTNAILLKQEEEAEEPTIGVNNSSINSSNNNSNSTVNNNHNTILLSNHQQQQDFAEHSGPTIDSINDDDDNEQEDGKTMVNNNIDNQSSILNKLSLTKIWNFFLKNVIAHLMIWTNLTLFSGFLILSPYGLKIYNPIIFSFFRGAVLVVSLFPIMLFIDRKFKFKDETKLINRAFTFRKSYPNIYGSKYWGWIYSLFYDDKATIPSFILARIPSYKQAKRLAWCGTLAVVNQLLFVAGLKLTSSTVTGAMQPLVAIMVCVISMMLGRETKSIVKFFGALIAVVGAISMLVASALTKDPINNLKSMEPDTFENMSPFERAPEYFALLTPSVPSKVMFIIGLICLFGNTFSYSLFLVTQKTLLDKGIPPLTVTFWSFFFGLAVSFLSSLYFFPNFNYRRVDLQSILSIIYAAVPYGAVQFSLSATASKLLTPTIVGVYSCVSPIVAIVTGVLAFGEQPSPWILLGASLILVGVLVVIGHRYVETKSTNNNNNPSLKLQGVVGASSIMDTSMEDKSSLSSTVFSSNSAANLDRDGITPISSNLEDNNTDDDDGDTLNFKSVL